MTIEQQALALELEAVKRARDNAIMQAQGWKMEAMCHRLTVHEAYRLCTGGKGEPGNWNGVRPIAAALAKHGLAIRKEA